MRSKPTTPSGAITDAEVARRTAEILAEQDKSRERAARAVAVAELARDANLAANAANKVAQSKANGHSFPHLTKGWESCPIPARNAAYATPPSVGFPFSLKGDGVFVTQQDGRGEVETLRLCSPLFPVGRYVQGRGLPVAVLQSDGKAWETVYVPTDKTEAATTVLQEAGAVFAWEALGTAAHRAGIGRQPIPTVTFLLRFWMSPHGPNPPPLPPGVRPQRLASGVPPGRKAVKRVRCLQ